VVLFPDPPSAADLSLLFLGLPAAGFRIGGHNLGLVYFLEKFAKFFIFSVTSNL